MPRGDATREKLLKAAIGLFHEFGYNATSVQDIVSAAKIPKGSFYSHFRSKEELAIAASDVFYPYALEFLRLENTSSPVARLRKYLRLTLKEMQRYGYVRGCLVGNFASEITNATPALKKRVSELLDEATRRIAVVVSQAQEAGELDPTVQTLDLSRFLLNSLYGAIFRSKTDRSERPMRLLQQFALDPFVIKKR
jgi:TetR/AcrR family transcriptional regulator, transcriptional repressor for nem operon